VDFLPTYQWKFWFWPAKSGKVLFSLCARVIRLLSCSYISLLLFFSFWVFVFGIFSFLGFLNFFQNYICYFFWWSGVVGLISKVLSFVGEGRVGGEGRIYLSSLFVSFYSNGNLDLRFLKGTKFLNFVYLLTCWVPLHT
jgi:hypothetical protein